MHRYLLGLGNHFFPAAQIFCSAARRHGEICCRLGPCTVDHFHILLYSKCPFPAHHWGYQFWAAVVFAMHWEQEALSVQVGVVALEGPCDTRGLSIEARHHSGEALFRRSLRAFFKTIHSFFLSQVLRFEVKYETELRCDDIPLALGLVSW